MLSALNFPCAEQGEDISFSAEKQGASAAERIQAVAESN